MSRGTGGRVKGRLRGRYTRLASDAPAALLAAGRGWRARVRAWPAGRVAMGAVAGLLLLSAALLGHWRPLQAQEAGASESEGSVDGPSIRFNDLVPRITHTIVHLFTVEVDGLSAAERYQVIVSSDRVASLGIGGCGQASETRTVGGARSQAVEVIVYACAVGSGTVTAEVRRAGAETAEATVSQDVTVLPIPDYVPADERPARGASGAAREGTPGIVQNVRVANRWSKSFKITWSPPAGNGGRALTGYGLLIWHKDVTQPPYSQAASIGVTDNHTFTGLQPSTGYKFKIHACNETDSCGWWTDIKLVTTAGRADPPHTIKFDQVQATSVRARWSIAANTGGVPLEGIEIQYWKRSSSSDKTTVTAGGNDRSKDLRGLAARTEYVVKLRACNDKTDCSASSWSADHRFTTTTGAQPEPIKTEPPGPDPPVATDPECPATGTAAVLLGNVQLDVVPQPGRQASVCWAPILFAESYVIQASDTVSDLHDSDKSDWELVHDTMEQDPVADKAQRAQVNLDKIITTSGRMVGLADSAAYGIRIGIRDDQDRLSFSAPLIIIDTPITKANGHSVDGDTATVGWKSIAAIVGSSYSNGQYELRYRTSDDDHRLPGWDPADFGPPADPVRPQSNPHQLGGLAKGLVHAIQLIARDAGPSSNIDVFAARNAFVWPNNIPPADGERVATFPLTNRLDDKTLTYKICTETFREDGRTTAWTSLIHDAFSRWQAAVGTDLIRIVADSEPCTDYTTVATTIVDQHRLLRMNPELTRQDAIDLVKAFIATAVNQQTLLGKKIQTLQDADRDANEIKMFDDLAGSQGYLYREFVFPEVASSIGQRTRCWYEAFEPAPGVVVWKFDQDVLMCTHPYVIELYDENDVKVGERHESSDIFVRRSKFSSDALERPESDAMFNRCGNDSDDPGSAYSSFIHEIGHALGLGGGMRDVAGGSVDTGRFAYPGHPEDTVLSTVNNARADCWPQPLDVMAIHALYQSR